MTKEKKDRGNINNSTIHFISLKEILKGQNN